MRKQKVQMVVLVAVLTLLIGGYFLLQQYNKKQAEKEEENKIQVAEIDADAIEAFSYQLDGETLSFTKTVITGVTIRIQSFIWITNRITSMHCQRDEGRSGRRDR